MNWITTLSVFVILIIISLIFFIFTPKPDVFFEKGVDNLNILVENENEIREAFDKVKTESSVIPIYANNIIKNTNYKYIYDLMCNIPNIRYAGLIILKPKFEQTKQYGYCDNANNTVRYFYCIKHSAAKKSGIWIDGQKKFFYRNEVVCGDMSREHSLFNKNKNNESVLLFLDIDRDSSIKAGRSPNNDISKDEILSVF